MGPRSAGKAQSEGAIRVVTHSEKVVDLTTCRLNNLLQRIAAAGEIIVAEILSGDQIGADGEGDGARRSLTI